MKPLVRLGLGCVCLLLVGLACPVRAAESEDAQEIVGTPETGAKGITESVSAIMARDKVAPRRLVEGVDESEREISRTRPHPALPNPKGAPLAQWPPAEFIEPSLDEILSPQVVGTSFRAVNIAESSAIPPDSMGDVGPTQILVHVNGRIKVFDKAGTLGALNALDTTFWNSVRNARPVTDPQIRYDRLSGRWILTAVNIPAGTGANNRVMIAVQTTPGTITATSNFTFYQFTVSMGGGTPSDANSFCDYPSLGVDGNALYIGCNMFVFSGTTNVNIWTTGFVVRKSSIIPAPGTLVVTAFRNLIGNGTGSGATSGTCGILSDCNTAPCSTNAGPYSPRGVDNDDGSATEGYFLGVDICFFSRLTARRVSNPGGTPTISGNIAIDTPLVTSAPILQPASGSTTNIDTGDDRLYTAAIHKNKISGASTLWTAQHIEVNSSCVATAGGGRNGARWYELGSMTSTPAVVQSGTLCDPAASNPRGFIYPSIAETGQGHMGLGITTAAANQFAGVAVAGRLRTDAAGSTQAATVVMNGLASYTLNDGASPPRNRWGDYSFTDVDPTDDMTLWTFQEYADAACGFTGGCWAVRAVQLRAAPPATPANATPASVCAGLPSVNVAITGTSSGGSEFFDPGPDPGGPGYANHISASVTGGVTVNSVTFTDPTHITLNLNTSAATLGAKNVTATNPDAQAATGNGILTISAGPSTPAPSNNGPICAGATLQLSTATVPGATYAWTGPNGFASSAQNPTIPAATPAASGTYNVTVTSGGCTSAAGSTSATVIATNGACGSASSGPCDNPDTCRSGVCQPNNLGDGSNCGDSGTACVNQDVCVAGVCQDNGFAGAGTACGSSSSGPCDNADTCNGSGVCQTNHVGDGTLCGDAGSACVNQDLCIAGVCQDNGFAGAGTACGSSSSGPCDNADTCNGSGVCQTNHVGDGTLCGDPGSACVNQDLCVAGVCQDNGFAGAGTACGSSSSGPCDNADTCNGAGVCQTNTLGDGSNCGDSGTACVNQDVCVAGVCQDNGFAGAGTACGSSSTGPCDNADTCNGSGVCQTNNVGDGTLCGDAGSACVNQDLCIAGVCQDNGFAGAGTACGSPSTGPCDNADTCDGSGVCQANHLGDGSNCGDSGTACVNQDVCIAGACQDNGFAGAGTACGSSSTGPCDNADTCNGAGVCQTNNVGDGTLCGDAGSACVHQDFCVAGACQDNGFASAGTACGSSSTGPCDNADACNGAGACLANHVTDGTTCSDADPTTCNDACAGGICAGTPTAEPSEINASVRIGGDKATISWTDPGGPYNVYRGSNGAGAWSYNQTCFSPNQAGSTASDPSTPASGTFIYYLISRRDSCRESVLGTDSSNTPDPNTSPCP